MIKMRACNNHPKNVGLPFLSQVANPTLQKILLENPNMIGAVMIIKIMPKMIAIRHLSNVDKIFVSSSIYSSIHFLNKLNKNQHNKKFLLLKSMINES